MEFPEILYKLRNDRYLSTGSFADKLDVSPSTISLWESGKRTPDYRTIIKLCNFFGCTADFLLGLNQETTDTLVLNLISNDHIIESHADYYRRRKSIGYSGKQYIENRKNFDKKIDYLIKQKELTKNFIKEKKGSHNEKLLMILEQEMTDLEIEISELERSKKESYESSLKKAIEISRMDQKQDYNKKIMYSIHQLASSQHYKNSLAYQILFLNDLGITLDTGTVSYSNHQEEIKKLYLYIKNDIAKYRNFLDNVEVKDILEYIKQESDRYIKILEDSE